jgi:hypothetical protein
VGGNGLSNLLHPLSVIAMVEDFVFLFKVDVVHAEFLGCLCLQPL